MSSEKKRLFLLFLIGSLAGILGMFLYQHFNNQTTKKETTTVSSAVTADGG